MKYVTQSLFALIGLFTIITAQFSTACAQGTAFTYQGRLNNNGAAASGTYNIQFTLYTTLSGELIAAGPLTNSAVSVTNGLFTTTVDFGPGVFNGAPYWLDLAVCTNGSSTFTELSPRQQLTATPYAIMANCASNLLGALPTAQLMGAFPATNLSGAIPSANFSGTYGNAISFNNGADSFDGDFFGQFFGSLFQGGTFTGQFLGDGSGLINLNPAHINGSVAFLNSNQTFTAQNVFMQPIGLANPSPSPYEQIDALAAQSNVRMVSTNTGNGAVLELKNLSSYPGEYLGAINFNETNNYNPGQIGYIAVNPTNELYDYFEFRVAGSVGLTIQGDPRGEQAANLIGGSPANSIVPGSAGDAIVGGGFPGFGNTISTNTYGVFIGAGSGNQVGPFVDDSVIVGGYGNAIQGSDSVIAGGQGNAIHTNATYSFIGSGFYNTIGTTNFGEVIGGGQGNLIDSYDTISVIGGGLGNRISGNYFYYTNDYAIGSTIAGGVVNVVDTNGLYDTVGGGYQNVIQSNTDDSTIGGGAYNTILGGSFGTVIGGGYLNHAQSYYATVPGGYGNLANGAGSFAAGTEAQATNNGSFVLADNEYANFSSTANNQLSARFTGGIVFVTGGAGMTLDGQPIFSGNNGAGLANVNAATLNGFSSSSFAPASGSANYIQNQSAGPQTASLDISGNAGIGGTLAVNSLTITNQFRVAGAGIGTYTPAFIQVSATTNIVGDQTVIYNPACDGDPNAILIATHNYSVGTAGYNNHPIGVFYNGSHWTIYNDDGAAMATSEAFNVLVIKH